MPNLNAFAFETIRITDKVISLTQDKIGSAERVFITCEEGDLRYRYDGGNPTITEGHLLQDGGFIVLQGTQQIKDVKFIKNYNSASDSNPKITASFERF